MGRDKWLAALATARWIEGKEAVYPVCRYFIRGHRVCPRLDRIDTREEAPRWTRSPWDPLWPGLVLWFFQGG